MADGTAGGRDLPHLVVTREPIREPYRPRGGGGGERGLYNVRNRAGHASRLSQELTLAEESSRTAEGEWATALRSDGLILSVETWPGDFELALESLDLRGSGIQLLSVKEGTETPPTTERATVFVPHASLQQFFRRLDQYATQDTRHGRPRNESLIANIATLRLAALRELWSEVTPYPETGEAVWWEIWLRRTGSELTALTEVSEASRWTVAAHAVEFPERTVTAVLATATSLGQALASRLPIAELRRPRIVQTPNDLPLPVQREWNQDLASRIESAPETAPCVCLLDTGIYRHTLFVGSLGPDDIYNVIGLDGLDRSGHGTAQAGLALFGSLDDALTDPGIVRLTHGLESVKIVPGNGEPMNRPETYAAVTAAGTVAPEVRRPDRRRIHCFANTRDDTVSDGRPTSWSATLDALAFGTSVESTARRITLLSTPNPAAGRLFVVAAGNVRDNYYPTFLANCDTSPVEDPAQAWNALTVGAFTELDATPSEAGYEGYRPLARRGELSPFSRTSQTFSNFGQSSQTS